MEYFHSDTLLNQKLLDLGRNIFKLVDFFEHSNVYDFIQKLLPSEYTTFFYMTNISFRDLFDRQKLSENLNKIPSSSRFIFSKMIVTIDNLISDLAFVLESPSDNLEIFV